MSVQLDVDHHKAEGKWDTDSTTVEYGDYSTKSPLNSFTLERTMASKGNDDNPRYNTSAYFDLSGGNIKEHEKDPKQLRERISNLLKGAGIENFEFEGSGNNSDFSVVMKDVEAGSLTRLAAALSTSFDMEHNATEFGLIDKDVAIRMANIERDALGDSVDTYTITKDELTEPGIQYVTYASGIHGSAIASIEQNGQLSDYHGVSVREEKTNVVLNDPGSRSDVVKALKAAGIPMDEQNSGRSVVVLDAPISNVAQALSEQNFIPQAANAEIQKEFAEVRPEFHYVASGSKEDPVQCLETRAQPELA